MDCLGPTTKVFKVNEGQRITSTCIYSGKPAPVLQCVLLDASNNIIRTTKPASVYINFNKYKPMILANVGRTTTSVRCIAFDIVAGKAERTRKVTVYCKYNQLFHCTAIYFSSFLLFVNVWRVRAPQN